MNYSKLFPETEGLRYLLLFLTIFAGFVGLRNIGLYPDELVDAQNAVALLKQAAMNTQIVEYNKLAIGSLQIPIYGIRPYNGTLLAYALAVPFFIFGISPLTLKLSSIALLAGAVNYMYRSIELISDRLISFSLTFLFVFSPFFLHFLRFDHGPLRLSLLLFWIFIYLFLSIRQHKPTPTKLASLYFVIGLGLFNHVVFVLALIFGSTVILQENLWHRYFPSSTRVRLSCLAAFLLPLLPFILDLKGFAGGWFHLFESAITNAPALGGRSPFSHAGLLSQVITRLVEFVAGRDVTAFQMEFGMPLKFLPYYWTWVTLLAFLLSLILSVSFGGWKTALNGRPVLIASLVTVACALVMPFIGSLHHMVYVQAMAVTILAITTKNATEAIKGSRIPSAQKITSATTPTFILFFVGIPACISVNYYFSVANTPARGLFSPQLLDVQSYIRNEFNDEIIITSGWGTHSYLAMLFQGNLRTQIFQSPAQLNGNIGLFQIDHDGVILNFNPQTGGNSEQREIPLKLADLENTFGLKAEKSVLIGNNGTSPRFLLVRFAQNQANRAAISQFVETIRNASRANRTAGADTKDVLRTIFSTDPTGRFRNDLGFGYIGYEQSLASPYILLSGIGTSNCLALVQQLRGIVDVRSGQFSRVMTPEASTGDMIHSCKLGNLWLLFPNATLAR